ncbi:MAG: hypothetical protein OEV42_06480 [Deltaproteobacteria bacterium]|nr:hypothetical protein [Deltaproteobacteria bacterium]
MKNTEKGRVNLCPFLLRGKVVFDLWFAITLKIATLLKVGFGSRVICLITSPSNLPFGKWEEQRSLSLPKGGLGGVGFATGLLTFTCFERITLLSLNEPLFILTNSLVMLLLVV